MFCLVSVWREFLGPRGRPVLLEVCTVIGGRAGICSGSAVPGVGQGGGLPWARRLTHGSLSPEDDTGQVEELQELLEKQNFELNQARERLVTLTATVAELEEDLGTARRDLIKSEELSSKHQRDLREVSSGPHLPPPGCSVQAFSTLEGSC